MSVQLDTELLFQRYTDETALLQRMMAAANDSTKQVEQAIIVGKAWKAFLDAFSPDPAQSGVDDLAAAQERIRELVQSHDNVSYALHDVRACLVAIDAGQLLDHVVIPDRFTGQQVDSATRLINMAIKVANTAIEASDL